MYKREIKPLSETMLKSIGNTINKLEHVEESVSFNGRTFKNYKTFNSEKEANDFLEKHDDHGVIGEKGGKVFVAKNSDMGMEESVDLEESKALLKDYQDMKSQGKKDSSIMDVLMSMPKYKRMTRDKMAKVIGDAKRKGVFKEESVDLEEAKMSDTEVLNAAKKLAENGKDAKTKAFGKGLVDFYKKNDSFTPDQVAGLQNIMKNATFQMAEETVGLEEEMVSGVESLSEAFSKAQVEALRKQFDGINKINPDSPNYKKLVSLLDKLDQKSLKSLESADIKFVSNMARNRLKEEVELEEKYAKATDKLDDGKGMDPVGKADADIDNDGDVDSSDEYLHKRRKAIAKAMKNRKMKEEVETLDEAKSGSDYTIYHKTFSSAVQHALSQVEKKGFEVDMEEWDRKVALGPKKPSSGKTNTYTLDLMKDGMKTPRKLQMQVYYDEGRYELNMYIS